MRERVKGAVKEFRAKKDNSVNTMRKTNLPLCQALSSTADHIMFLQRVVGNHAVQGLFNSGVIQAKLRIGQPNDIYERKADKVADQVMRMPDSAIQPKATCASSSPSCGEEEPIQTKPLNLEITPLAQRQVEEESIMTKGSSESTPQIKNDLQSKLQLSRGGGQPLPEADRSFMERRFGVDFSSVRVHTDSNAIQMNRELNAQAFTHGRDIYFGAGKYSPSISLGKRLLAHELTHVVQQSSDGVQRKLNFNPPGHDYKQEPDRVLCAIVQRVHRPIRSDTNQGIVRGRQSEWQAKRAVQGSSQGGRSGLQISNAPLSVQRGIDCSSFQLRGGGLGNHWQFFVDSLMGNVVRLIQLHRLEGWQDALWSLKLFSEEEIEPVLSCLEYNLPSNEYQRYENAIGKIVNDIRQLQSNLERVLGDPVSQLVQDPYNTSTLANRAWGRVRALTSVFRSISAP